MADISQLLESVTKARDAGHLNSGAEANLRTWLSENFLPGWAEDALAELIGRGEWTELNDRFYQYLKFGTGGMRGRTIGNVSASVEQPPAQGQAPAHPGVGTAYLNDFNIVRATIGLYRYCEQHIAKDPLRFEKPKLVIATDVRHFNTLFQDLAASTWTRLGGTAVVFPGPRSTPQLSFTVRQLKATAGIVITASHNPPHDNGYKVYFEDGGQVVAPHASGIIEQANTVSLGELTPFLEPDTSQVAVLGEEADEAYFAAVEEVVLDHEVIEQNPPRIVFSPIHGTGGLVGFPLLERFGIEALSVGEQNRMDGNFPTVKSPNPENAEALSRAIEKMQETGADAVLATDPDADRMGAAVPGPDGQPVVLTGNVIGSLLAEYRVTQLKDMEILPLDGTRSAAIIKTFVTTPMQQAIAEKHGLKCINTLTGFKWIGEKLAHYELELKKALFEEEGIALDYDQTDISTRVQLLLEYSTFYVFGGEESYGYLASDLVRDKDANSAVLMFCELLASLKKRGQSLLDYLDELYLKYGYYRESLLNIYMEGAQGAAKIRKIIDSYRENPPTELGGVKVKKLTDYGVEALKDADGKAIPREDFYFLELEDGYSFAARGSGTEPKIKFYTFARETVSGPDALAAAKDTAAQRLKTLEKAIDADARARAEAG